MPIGLLLIVLKIGLEVYDIAQIEIGDNKNWALLEKKIISLSDKNYLKTLISLLGEIDYLKKPVEIGSNQKWKYLNQDPEIALKVYTLIASLDETAISPDRRKIKTLSIIGLDKIENSFQHVFQVFERTNNQKAKYQLAQTLARIANTAQTHSLFVFIEYVLKDYTYLREDLMNSISSRAQDFNREEIQKILKLAAYPYQSGQVRFYLQRTRYFFNKAFDNSANRFREDAHIWLTKIVQDFSDPKHPSSYYLRDKQSLNEESGILLAIACRELNEYQKAIAALEHVLGLKPNSLPAIMQLIYIYELIEDFEQARKVLIRVRTEVASNEWFQNKLKEYDLV